MNTPEAQEEINSSLTATQADYDENHFEAWLTEEENRRGMIYKDAEHHMKKAWLAGIAHARSMSARVKL
jgi:hypothetical protein